MASVELATSVTGAEHVVAPAVAHSTAAAVDTDPWERTVQGSRVPAVGRHRKVRLKAVFCWEVATVTEAVDDNRDAGQQGQSTWQPPRSPTARRP